MGSRWLRVWTVLILFWGLVLLVSNGPLVPDASYVSSYDVYRELSPVDQSKVYPSPAGYHYVPVGERNRLRYLPPPPPPPSDELNLPDPRSFLGPSPRTLDIEGHEISFPDGVSDEEMQAVAADFKIILQKKVSRARMLFGLEGIAWWAASTSAFFAFGWLFVIIRRLARPERWHPGQLVLVWVGAAALEFALFRAFNGDDVARLFTFLLQVPPYGMWKDTVFSFSVVVLGLMMIVTFIGIPLGTFVFTWIWFGSRQARG
jgi:hypothetical protein